MLDTIKLRKELNKKLNMWNERSQFTIGGVSNLSRADIDTLFMCCNWHDKFGSLIGLFVNADIGRVLSKFGWEDNNNGH